METVTDVSADHPRPGDGEATPCRAGVTVVVPTRDRPEMLRRCLKSVAGSLGDRDELIVVDSASAQRVEIAQVALEAGANLVRCERPGASTARNAGWRAARNDLVVFLDDDVWVDDLWLEALASPFAHDPLLAFVTGRIEIPPGQEPRLPVAVKRDRESRSFDSATRGALGHSASLAVRHAVMEDVGGFDEALGAGARFRAAEDADLFDRLLGHGYLGRYEAAALSWHDQWRTLPELARLDFGYGIGEGAQLAKLVRSDRRRARTVGGEYLWTWGLVELWRATVGRHKFMVLTTSLRLAGLVKGFVTAIADPVLEGRFRG